MEDTIPTKRRRTGDSDDVDVQEVPLVRSTDYWFDDGNIILQVESTQFRVAKSVLSRHSSVFRDMFLVPLPADEPTVEDCPVVVLVGDTAQDWALFLGAMYPESLTVEAPSLALIAAILRLSKKYDFPVFHKDCVRRLKTEFPTTLMEYDNRRGRSWTSIKEADIYLHLLPFARDIGLHSIFPLAYACMVDKERYTYLHKILDVNNQSMDHKDRFACLLGIVKLQILQSTTTLRWLDLDPFSVSAVVPCDACIQEQKCVSAVKDIVHDGASTQPPHLWIISEWNEDWDEYLCRYCRDEARDAFNDGRKECWNKLPSMFGFPNWKTLRSMDFE
ncbi:hypothetical protein C8R45DRAFT_1021412 [Mycena sanguinolenta]|nr:hypothetical protein C8R45DRAFT_1021412 [Mycena sanguinolenta]